MVTKREMILTVDYTKLAHLVTGKQSRELDRLAIHHSGLSGFTLMETAGKGAAEELIRYYSDFYAEKEDDVRHHRVRSSISASEKTARKKVQVLCVCGKGNNAGDALAAARYLVLSGHFHVDIFLAAGQDSLTEDTTRNLDLFRQFSPTSHYYSSLEEALYPTSAESTEYQVVVDGLLGTGVQAPLREPYVALIHVMNVWRENRDRTLVVSMDLPSGLHADTGHSTGAVVHADLTCSLGPVKTGHLLHQGPYCSGKVIPITLSFPLHLHKGYLRRFDLTDRSGLSGAAIPYARRTDKTSHKYDQGVVYVIGGSPGLTGAAIMASRAAWKKGAGAVFLATPDALLHSIEDQVPELIKIQTGTGHSVFQPQDATILASQIKKRPGAVLIGPGLGKAPVENGFLRTLLEIIPDLPLVLDADALRGWTLDEFRRWRIASLDCSSDKKERGRSGSPIVFTPHPGEAGELFHDIEPGPESVENWGFISDDPTLRRLQVASEVSSRYEVTICSKGNPTGVSTPHFQAISGYASEGFHRAGFGDVLSGQIVANLSFGTDPAHAVLDALLHGFEIFTIKSRELTSPVSPEDIL